MNGYFGLKLMLLTRVYNGSLFMVLGPLLLVGGCASVKKQPVATGSLIQSAGNRDLADRDRLNVLEELARRSLKEHERALLGGILVEVMGSNSHSPVIREKAIELMVDRYRQEAPAWLGQTLLKTSEPSLQKQLLHGLAQLNDTRSLPYLIMTLADGQEHRLAVQTIEKISGKALADVLADHWMARDNRIEVRLAGLNGLVKCLGKEQVIANFLNRPTGDDDEFHRQLRFWARHFGILPRNRREYLQGCWQRIVLDDGRLADLEKMAKRLSEQVGYEFTFGDSYTLLKLAQCQVDDRSEQLVAWIRRRLARREHTRRVARYTGAADDRTEDFDSQFRQLKYTDLVRIRWFLETLATDACQARLGRLIEADTDDDISEVGGLCFRENQGVVFRDYEPARRMGNQRYVESPKMIQDSWFALARWHCHVVAGQEGQLCGPGLDDLRLIQEKQTQMVIVSVVRKNGFNVDYITAQGQVIDLGNYFYQ